MRIWTEPLGSNIEDLTGGGDLVAPGEEIDFGFTQNQVAEADGKPLVTLSLPSTGSFLATVIARQLVSTGIELDTSIVSSFLAVAGCLDKFNKADGPASVAAAAVECIRAGDEQIAKELARVLVKTGKHPKAAGQVAGSVLAKISIYAALIGPVSDILNWSIESTIPDSARTFTAFIKTTSYTAVTNLNPLTTSGRLKDGYRLDDQSDAEPVDCAYDEGSPAAVTRGTHSCGGTADGSDACWDSPRYPEQVLCVSTPWDKLVHARAAVNLDSRLRPRSGQSRSESNCLTARGGGCEPAVPGAVGVIFARGVLVRERSHVQVR